MKKVVAFVLALSMVMLFAVSFAAEEVASPTTAEVPAVEEAAPVVEEAPAVEEVAPVVEAASGHSVVINGVEYCYVTFTEQAKWIANGGAVYWCRIFKNDAYLFSMVSGAFVGKFDVKLLSYVEFTTELFPNFSQLSLVSVS